MRRAHDHAHVVSGETAELPKIQKAAAATTLGPTHPFPCAIGAEPKAAHLPVWPEIGAEQIPACGQPTMQPRVLPPTIPFERAPRHPWI
jgi:hypothetical protein